MNNRAGQQGQSTDSCPEIKTTQKLYIKQKLTINQSINQSINFQGGLNNKQLPQGPHKEKS